MQNLSNEKFRNKVGTISVKKATDLSDLRAVSYFPKRTSLWTVLWRQGEISTPVGKDGDYVVGANLGL